MHLETLFRLMPPPKQPVKAPSEATWSPVERKLGTHFPEDYKRLIQSYGEGQIEGHINLSNPQNLLKFWNRMKRAYTDPSGATISDDMPYPFFPEADGLLLWATDNSGVNYFWRTSGQPSSWPTLLTDGEGEWERFDMPASTFLAKALTRKLRPKLWPKEFPPRKKQLVFSPG